MPYARFDDRYDDHRKVRKAWRSAPAAIALHAMAITFCNRHANDGSVDAEWIEEKLALLPYGKRERERVLAVALELELFDRVDADTYRVHDFLDWNLSAKQRKALAEQGRRGGLVKADRFSPPDGTGSSPRSSQGFSQGQSNGHTEGLSQGSSTPTPTPTVRKRTASSSRRAPVGADPTPASDDDARLCRLLAEQALQRNPKFKVKSRDRWLTSMRLLRERDGNTPAEIERSIRWVFADDFWGGVIQSPANLRAHFAAVWDQMNRRGAQVIRLGAHLPEGQRATPEHQEQVAAFAAARAAECNEDELAAFRAAMKGESA